MLPWTGKQPGTGIAANSQAGPPGPVSMRSFRIARYLPGFLELCNRKYPLFGDTMNLANGPW